MESADGEQPTEDSSTLEELRLRHKKELKELQGRILKLRKSVSRGDKKQRKLVDDEIGLLEKELQERHEKENKEILDAVSN
jgi:OTU domain-containing protein 6